MYPRRAARQVFSPRPLRAHVEDCELFVETLAMMTVDWLLSTGVATPQGCGEEVRIIRRPRQGVFLSSLMMEEAERDPEIQAAPLGPVLSRGHKKCLRRIARPPLFMCRWDPYRLSPVINVGGVGLG